jgi:hypothetical protein
MSGEIVSHIKCVPKIIDTITSAIVDVSVGKSLVRKTHLPLWVVARQADNMVFIADSKRSNGGEQVQVLMSAPNFLKERQETSCVERSLRMETDEKRVYELLKELGIYPANKGYSYLTAVLLMRMSADRDRKSLSIGDSYTAVGERFNASYRAVEKGIRQVNQKMFESMQESPKRLALIQEVFGENVTSMANKYFISSICEYLKFSR